MTTTIRNGNVTAKINQCEAGSYVVVANDEQKLFEYSKLNLDISLLKLIIDHKLISCICLN